MSGIYDRPCPLFSFLSPTMRVLYRLQHHVALTRPERHAVLMLSALLLVGLVARHVQRHAPLSPDVQAAYAEDMRLLAAGPADAASARAWPLLKPPGPTGPVPLLIPPAASASATAPDTDTRINLNTADALMLQQLPRIGPALAERMLTYRETHGPFQSIDDVARVRGIGPKTLVRLRPLVRVD